MSLQYIYDISSLIFWILFGISAFFCLDKLFYIIAGFLPRKKFPPAQRNYRYALLIPARNESKVIESLLKSIEDQTYPKDLIDVFVVVEDENDPTIQICSKYNARVTVRKHLELKGKGYAMDELLQDMYNNGFKNKYDAYFVFDADNYLSPSFIEEMNKAYNAGYDIAVGFRNSKNWNGGWVASCSALNFSIVNTFHNNLNSKVGGGMMVSGTGFYIDARIIDSMNGWKFYCLTEDLELSNFSALNNLKSTYCADAEFYDEQPSSFRVSSKQRTRWLKGYFQAAKLYNKRIVGSILKEKKGRIKKLSHLTYIVPVIVLTVVVSLYGYYLLGLGVYALIVGNNLYSMLLINATITLGSVYVGYMFFCLLCLLADIKRIDISFFSAVKTVLLGPFYLFWYAPLFMKAFFKKEVKWDAIEHNIDFSLPAKKV